MAQDPLFELLERWSGVETELVGQHGPDPLVGRQRIGLSTRSVLRRDQQRPQALLERMGPNGRFQLTDHIARLPKL